MNRSRRPRYRGPGPRRPSGDELRTRSDEQLVELVLGGQDAAFDVLFDRHVADSLWYAREVLGSWGEAEEAVRHSFAAAHAYLATRGRETEFWPWLQTILGNYCLSMLQARAPGPEKPASDCTVVDLGEWRLRRKLFGIALPVAPGGGIRESILAACGIGGAGATTSGAPLLGGAVAKVAVVAVLAGGAGVAGDAASDRAVPGDTGARAAVERTVDVPGGSRSGIERGRESTGGADGAPTATVREVGSAPRSVHEGPARHRAPAEPSPREPSPATGGETSAGVRAPTPDSAAPAVSKAVPPPVESALGRVVDVVKARVPAGGDLQRARLPVSLGLSKIGDDLGVTAVKPPVDVRALLSRGTVVLSK